MQHGCNLICERAAEELYPLSASLGLDLARFGPPDRGQGREGLRNARGDHGAATHLAALLVGLRRGVSPELQLQSVCGTGRNDLFDDFHGEPPLRENGLEVDAVVDEQLSGSPQQLRRLRRTQRPWFGQPP